MRFPGRCVGVIAAKPIPIIEYNPTDTLHLFWSGKWRQFSALAFVSLLSKYMHVGKEGKNGAEISVTWPLASGVSLYQPVHGNHVMHLTQMCR